VQLNRPATREGDPRHHELSHRNELLAGVAFLPIGWTALRSRDPLVGQTAVLELLLNEETKSVNFRW
jgi:hypothetical protein